MSELDLVARVCDAVQRYLALGNESFIAHDAMFVRNRRRMQHFDSNHVGLIRTPDSEVAALWEAVEREFSGFGFLRIDVDALTPPSVTARLTLEDGYRKYEYLHQLLEGELALPGRRASAQADIREVLSDDEWLAYRRLDAMWWQEMSVGYLGEYDPRLHDGFLNAKKDKAPAVRSWLAFDDGSPAAFFSSWPGEDGIGIVEDLYTRPEYRHRGLATALLAHCVGDARERGAGPVLITSEPGDTPKHMYAAMGFRPLCVSRNYVKMRSSG